jgi:uncharacterized protein (TIGR02453 family)
MNELNLHFIHHSSFIVYSSHASSKFLNSMLHSTTIQFLKDLKKNNNKPWFEQHRDRYDAAKKDFGEFIQALIERHGKKDKTIAELSAKNCIFRINRDIRFAKDKTPYKSHLGASLDRGGRKSGFAGYYFHCEPGQSLVGGGLWAPMPPELRKVRQEIDYCYPELKKITGSKKFKAVYGDLYKGEDAILIKVPQGFEKDSPAAEYLRLKSFIAMKPVKDADLTSKDLVKKVIEAFETLQPLLYFINRALETENEH